MAATVLFGIVSLGNADDPRWFNYYPESGAIAWRDAPRFPLREDLFRVQREVALRVLECARQEQLREHFPPQAARIPVVFDQRTGAVLWPRAWDGPRVSYWRCTSDVARTMRIRPFSTSEPVGVWFPIEGTQWWTFLGGH